MENREEKYVEMARGGARGIDQWNRGRGYSRDQPEQEHRGRELNPRMDGSSRWQDEESDGRRDRRASILSRVGERHDRKRAWDDRDQGDGRGGKWRRSERWDGESGGRRNDRDGEFDSRRTERWDEDFGGRRAERRDRDHGGRRNDRDFRGGREYDGGKGYGNRSNMGGGRDTYGRTDSYDDRGGHRWRDDLDQRGAYGRRDTYGGRDSYRDRDQYGDRGGYGMNQLDDARNRHTDDRRSVREDSELRSQGGDVLMREGGKLRDVLAEFPFGFVLDRSGQEWEQSTGALAELEFLYEPPQHISRRSGLVAC